MVSQKSELLWILGSSVDLHVIESYLKMTILDIKINYTLHKSSDIRAENFWMVDIGIKAWSTLFLNLEIK